MLLIIHKPSLYLMFPNQHLDVLRSKLEIIFIHSIQQFLLLSVLRLTIKNCDVNLSQIFRYLLTFVTLQGRGNFKQTSGNPEPTTHED